jgi:hypothetical protein
VHRDIKVFCSPSNAQVIVQKQYFNVNFNIVFKTIICALVKGKGKGHPQQAVEMAQGVRVG